MEDFFRESWEIILLREFIVSWDVGGGFLCVISSTSLSTIALSLFSRLSFRFFLLSPHAASPFSLEYPRVSSPSFWTRFYLTQWSRWKPIDGKAELTWHDGGSGAAVYWQTLIEDIRFWLGNKKVIFLAEKNLWTDLDRRCFYKKKCPCMKLETFSRSFLRCFGTWVKISFSQNGETWVKAQGRSSHCQDSHTEIHAHTHRRTLRCLMFPLAATSSQLSSNFWVSEATFPLI